MNLPETLEIFDSHFPGFAVFPGSAILEGLVELAAAVVRDTDRPEWVLCAADEIRFRRYVRPGDELELWVERVDPDDGAAMFRARAVVDGMTMMTVRRLELSATEPVRARRCLSGKRCGSGSRSDGCTTYPARRRRSSSRSGARNATASPPCGCRTFCSLRASTARPSLPRQHP